MDQQEVEYHISGDENRDGAAGRVDDADGYEHKTLDEVMDHSLSWRAPTGVVMQPLNEWCNVQGEQTHELHCEYETKVEAEVELKYENDTGECKYADEEYSDAYTGDEMARREVHEDRTHTYRCAALCDATTSARDEKRADTVASRDAEPGGSTEMSASDEHEDEEGDLTVACAQLKADIRTAVLSPTDFTALCRLFRGLALRDAESLETDAEDIQRFVESRLATRLHAQSTSALHACSLVLRLQKLVALEARLCELRE